MTRLALDDLDGQAREAWGLAPLLCRGCGHYHASWGLLTAAGVLGPAIDRRVLADELPRGVGPGARVLIAGAADAGLLRLVLALIDARPLSVDVADRCPTPLGLIDRIEPLAGVTVRTLCGDLAGFSAAAGYDLILCHSMLSFLDPTRRVDVLRRLGDALTPKGRLILTVRIAGPVSAAAAVAREDAWLSMAQARIAALPGFADLAGERLDSMLAAFAAARGRRVDAFSDTGEVGSLIEQAWLRVERRVSSGLREPLPADGRAQRREAHVFVAVRA